MGEPEIAVQQSKFVRSLLEEFNNFLLLAALQRTHPQQRGPLAVLVPPGNEEVLRTVVR